ncbi:MAG: hypothetical protein Q9181_003219 [Wetmoreana brouardii]
MGMNDSIDRGAGSPLPPRQVKSFARAEQHTNVGRDITPQTMGPSCNHSDKDSNASPAQEARYEQIKSDSSWHHLRDFHNNCRPDNPEDPFVVSRNQAAHVQATIVEGGFQPREDRANLPLSADTAQAMLPPNACVFVANLTQSQTDEQLEKSVAAVFQAFGNVYVKIRRDNKNMPFAFCQYEQVRDAQRAITMGRGLLIDGRPCRTEVAKVNRSLYLSKITGGSISEDEAREVLGRFGAIEKLWYCSDTDKEMFRLPEGVWVMFAFFQDCRDAQAGFRDDPTYRLEQPRMPEDMRQRLGARSHPPPVTQRPRFSPGGLGVSPQESPQAMMKRITDLSSIFVGNLPVDATDDKLRELFGLYGRIVQIEIVRKPSVNGPGVNTFAFIQFCSIEEADRAACYLYQLQGHRLRVERKESVESLARRDAMFSGGSPRNRPSANSQKTMELMFQRGVSVGMANATASQSPTAAPSIYPAYNTLQHYSVPHFAPAASPSRVIEHEPSQGLQAHAPAFVPQSLQHGMAPMLGQYELPTIMQAQTAQYTPTNAWTQRTTNYQWPPAASAAQGSPSIPTITKEEVP